MGFFKGDVRDMQDEHTQQIATLERKVMILERLVTLSTNLTASMQLNTLLGHIMETAAEITECEAASVLLWNQNTRELFFAATTTNSEDLIGTPVPLEGSIAGRIMRERRIITVDDAESDPEHYRKVDEQTPFVTRSLMGIPMTVKNRLIGVLEVINKRQMPWTDEDRNYISALATQAAVAIESAQLVNRLRKANEELSQVDKLKNDFIAIASHELRTPLGVILGYASFLQEETTNDSAQEHAHKVMNSALRLRKIIEDLTNLRYLQQNAADLQLAPMKVDDVIRDLRFDVITLLETKNVKLDLPEESPDLTVNVDRARLVMAVTNILINAIEFSPNGSTITVRTEKRAQEVWLSIRDEGIGIEAENLSRIFDKFYQVENHMTRHHEGLGIGLSICKALVEAHSGRVWAESEGKGKGTTFTVSLPLHEA